MSNTAANHQMGRTGALLYRNVQWFRGGLVFKAHRRVYHSTLGSRDIKQKKVWGVHHAVEHCKDVLLRLVRDGGVDLRFRGGLVVEAHRILYHSTLGLRVTKKKQKGRPAVWGVG